MFASAEEITEFLKHINYYNNVLINNPQPISGQLEPFCLYYCSYNKPITHSIIVPVYNQENIIERVLKKIIKNTKNLITITMMTVRIVWMVVNSSFQYIQSVHCLKSI